MEKPGSKCNIDCTPKLREKKSEYEPELFLHLIQSCESQSTSAFKQAEDLNKGRNPPLVFWVRFLPCYYTEATDTLSVSNLPLLKRMRNSVLKPPVFHPVEF